MRSHAFVLLLISFFFVQFARSQSNELIVQGQAGKLYLEHTVVAKENWYSIGRLYNANPIAIATFNHLAMKQPLNIGQTLQIPLLASNFSQTGQKIASETLVPVYHIIQEKEWLYRISINHNKVPVPSLEKWNNINKDQAKAGMHLIVGFLKVKTAQSALAQPPAGKPLSTSTPATVAASESPAGKSLAKVPPPTDTAKTTQPAATKQAGATTQSVTSKPLAATTQPGASLNTNPLPPAGKPISTSATEAPPAAHFNGGFFKAEYSETGKSASGLSGTFRSTSGWQDGKYYALMNNVTVGTIVKVSIPGSDKSVYAKVLGQLPDMKESAGLTIRISTAAASELGAGDGRINVEIRY
jgi:hypothetical protein